MTHAETPRPRGRRIAPVLSGVLLLLLLGGLLCASLAWRASGLTVQGVRWQAGLQVAHWHWSQAGCVVASGEGLHWRAEWPLSMTLDHLDWHDCPAPAEDNTPWRLPDLPWTPPLDLRIERLTAAGLPPLAVSARQRDQQWQLHATHQDSHAAATLARDSCDRTLNAALALSPLWPDALGTVTLQGAGRLRDGLPDGALSAAGTQLGYAGRPQRADARLQAQLQQQQWRAALHLSDPVALPAGWQLVAGETLSAAGHLEQGIEQVSLSARASGPQGEAQLMLATDAPGIAQGQGHLILTGEQLGGEVPLRWTRHTLTLSPAQLTLPAQVTLGWDTPLAIPLAAEGMVALPLDAHWETLHLTARDSEVTWQGADWRWRGALALAGEYAGYRVRAAWHGDADADGVRGAPLTLAVRDADLRLDVTVPTAQLSAPAWRTDARFTGQYQDFPLTGRVQAQRQDGQWQGRLRGDSRLVVLDQGGELQLDMPWRLTADNRLQLMPGELRLQRGLLGTLLLRPMTVRNAAPVTLDGAGAHGRFALHADGAVAERWRIPAITGELVARGNAAGMTLAVPDWQSRLAARAALTEDGMAGDVSVTSPLSPAMSDGLSMTFRGGLLDAQGDWQWRDDGPSLEGNVRLRDLQLDWGGITASGGAGELAVRVRGEQVTLASRGPVTLTELDIGTPIRNLRMTLEQADLATWSLSDIYADVLGGYLRAPALDWPSPAFQPVVISRISLDQVAALQTDPVVQLAGRVGGYLPLQLGTDSVAVQGGRLANEEPLALLLMPSSSTSAMAGANRAVQLALDSLSVLQISDFQASLDMTADGWLDAAVTIRGENPQQKRLPVVFNYTHRENVLVLLRSLRIGDEISRQVMDRLPQ